MKSTISLAAAGLFGAGVLAFPAMPNEVFTALQARQLSSLPGSGLSAKETNCGPRGPCLKFDEKEQFVSTSGNHKFISPGKNDIRGPCPGLNAAANHGYLPRNGVPSITQTITGLGQLYGMSVDLAGFLAVYAVVFDGDVLSQSWSIGGPPPYINVGGLLSPPQGISKSHNKYEGDSSIGRNDAYINNGDATSLNVTRFGYAFRRGQLDGTNRYTADKLRKDVGDNQQLSVENNPHYFAPLFSTTLVSPAAYNFIINFMSNHSAKEPSGYLNGAMFKQFFAVKGRFDNSKESSGFGFTWQPGQERIPDNWYRRPSSNPYNAADVFLDLATGWAAYPETFRFGGNTNGVNTYEGIDLSKLTGGSITDQSVLAPKNFACLIFQSQQQAVPDAIKGTVNTLASALSLLDKYTGFFKSLQCPALAKYDTSIFDKYPGAGP